MQSWATEQLTEFLAAVSSLRCPVDAVSAAAERAAELLDAEVGVVVRNGEVVSTVGFGSNEPDAGVLQRAARGELAAIEVDGVGSCRVAAADLQDEPGSALLVARSGGDGFAADELNLLRGMSRVLAIVLANLGLVESGRAHAQEKQLLTASLQQHALLLEQLSRLQASISDGAGLQEVFDTVVEGAAAVLHLDIAALKLIDATDPGYAIAVGRTGIVGTGERWMRRTPVAAGAGGRAIATGELVTIEDYHSAAGASPLAPPEMQSAMAVPVREHGQVVGSLIVGSREPGKRWSESERELLSVYAAHASLTLAATRTADQMHHAFNDPLTDLPTRALFLDRLEHQLVRAERDGSPVSVLFLDLDRFKLVNDTLGHVAGDRLLLAVADRLRGCLRAADTCSRLGSDEFAVLLGSDSDPEWVAERILAALRPPFDQDGRQLFVSASIGIATGSGDAETLLRHADVAMYRAKALGNNRFARFEQSMQDDLMQRLELDADLRRAIDREEFELHYQPILDLATSRVVAVEALLRWHHPERGLVPPLDFIPLAEETGLIHRIGRWVLEEACRQATAWQRELRGDPPVAVSVNLSGRQLQQPDLVEQVAAALGTLDPSCLLLEITETVLMHDTDHTIETLARLKELGVRIAIDDFGTGYSSLRYLSRFPADVLKIAKPFVDEIGADGAGESALTRAIVDLGSVLGVQTVGEGIEEQVQEDRLRVLGCTLGQGYHFSRPVTLSSLRELLREDSRSRQAA